MNLLTRVRQYFRDLRQDARSVLEPVLILHGVGKYRGVREIEFRRNILQWREPCIDTTTLALDTAYDLGARYYVSQRDRFAERRDELLEKLKRDLFDQDTGGFRQTFKVPASVYATHFAVAILKHLVDIRDLGQRLGAETANALLGADYVQRAVEFVKGSQDPETGGFVQSPLVVRREQPSVLNTYAACFFLWDLEVERELAEASVEFLMRRCYKPALGGFSEHPGGEALICSTRWALRCLKFFGEEEKIQATKSGTLDFLERCWDDRYGGFRPSPGFPNPTLAHTAYACAIILDIFHEPDFFTSERRGKLLSYIERCQSRSVGGFKFGFGGDLPPNVYVTQNVVSALRLLAVYFKEFDELYERNLDATRAFIDQLDFSRGELLVSAYAWKNKAPTRLFRRLVDLYAAETPQQGFEFTPLPLVTFSVGLGSLGLMALPVWLFGSQADAIAAKSVAHVGLLLFSSAAAVAIASMLESGLWAFRYKRKRD